MAAGCALARLRVIRLVLTGSIAVVLTAELGQHLDSFVGGIVGAVYLAIVLWTALAMADFLVTCTQCGELASHDVVSEDDNVRAVFGVALGHANEHRQDNPDHQVIVSLRKPPAST